LKYSKSELKFQLINLYSIISLFIVILAGGIVRSTGSGMGCPDWPKCFGRYIPPVNETQLPKDYRTHYIEKQLKKNHRFAKVLETLGYSALASKIKGDTSVNNRQQEEFNPAKTWTEYLNRLVGVITGILLLATTFYSFVYATRFKSIVYLSFFNLILIAFQAWLGSIVVSSNLVPWIVTVHMLVALAILSISIYTWNKSRYLKKITEVKTKTVLIAVTSLALLTDIIQITIGTEVREKIDEYASKLNDGSRQSWVNGANEILLNHKNAAIAVIIINIITYFLLKKYYDKSAVQRQLMSAISILIVLQIFAGVLLSYLGLPPIAQVAHILLASLLFSAQFYLLLNLFKPAGVSGDKYYVG